MQLVPLSKTKIETKLAIIREGISELQKLIKESSKEDFLGNNMKFGFAEHQLRRTLEAIFDIGAHIISRFPYSSGRRPKEYKEIATALGDRNIVDKNFALETLVKIAGYRNRLVHFYFEITKEELFDIISNKITDLEFFANAIVSVIKNPEKYDLTIEE